MPAIEAVAKRWSLARNAALVLCTLAVLAGLLELGQRNYLLFHSLAELFAIAVAWSVFLLVWNTRRLSANAAMLFLGVAYLFVGAIDLVHTVTYKGMGTVANDQASNYATQLWIGARGLEAASLLLFPLLLGRRFRNWYAPAGFAAVTALLFGTIFVWDVFPVCYVDGQGLTPFKAGAEYAICLTLFVAMVLLYLRREHMEAGVVRLVLAAMGITIASELAFTLYTDVYGLSNAAGHLLKIVSFIFVYLALVRTTVIQPYATMFRELADSNRQLATLMGNLSGMAYQCRNTESWPMLFVSEGCKALTGYDAAVLTTPGGVQYADLIYPDDRDMVWRTVQEALDSDRHFEIEYRIVTRDGHLRWVWERGLLVGEDDEGNGLLEGFIGDIAQRKRAEEELRASEAEYRELVECANVIILRMDTKGRVAFFNTFAQHFFGYDESEIIGRNVVGTIVPETESTGRDLEEMVRDIVANPHQYAVNENENMRKNGERVWVAWTNRGFTGKDGLVSEILCVGADITERKRAEVALHASESRMNSIFRAAPVGIGMVVDRVIVEANDRLCEMTGYAREELLNHRSRMLYPTDEDFNYVGREKYRQISERGTGTVETRWQRKDGQIIDVLLSSTPLVQSDWSKGVTFTALDITERKRVEAALKKRMIALTRPLEDLGPDGVAFEELFNVHDIQRLQDEFALATGVASIITRPDGTPITQPSGFCRLCNDIIRKTEKGRENCYKSDAVLGHPSSDGPIIRPCLSGGLWDAGAGISVGGKHVANWLIGQVRDETQTDEKMRAYAREIGAEEDAVIEAFHEVPAMSSEQFKRVSQALFTLATQLSDSAYQNVQQARFITERDAAEEALRLSEERFALAVDGTRDGLWDWNLKTGEAYHSDHFARMLGYDPDELPYTSEAWSDLLHPDDREAAFVRVQKYLDGKAEQYESTFRMRTKDGSYRWITGRGRCVRDSNGAPVRMVGFNTDITDQKEAEEEVRRSEEKFRALFEKSPIGVAYHRMVYDDAGKATDYYFLDANDNYLKLTGVDPKGKLATEAFPGIENDPFDWIGTFARCARDGETIRFQQHLQTNDRWYDCAGFQTAPDHFVAAFLDITEQKRLEEQLRQAQKMEAVGQLAGGVAHDFNNLLQVIVGYGQMAMDELGENNNVHEALTEILQAGNRAKGLVAQLLAFSRRQVLEMKDVDLNEAIGDMLRMLRRVIGEHIDLRFHAGHQLGTVRADAGQIGQILTNLCVNGRDAMPGGGAITIATENVRVDEAYCARNSEARPGRYVLLSVTDTGCGMDEETTRRVFEPFFTTKEVGKGSGLGLSTVYGLVKQHDGFVDVYSEVDKGTTFKVFLPLVERKASALGSKVEGPVPGGNETILLAEDEGMVRSLAKAILERAGYTVLTAGDGEEALSVYEANANRIDLLLLDVVMPKLGGRAAYERIRERSPGIRVLFASGYSMNSIHTDFVLEEGLRLIQKPAERNELLRKVREALDAEHLEPV